MKKKLLSLMVGIMFTGLATAHQAIDLDGSSTLNLNVENSELNWSGYKVTGQHHGSIALKSGQIQMDGDKLTGGFFVIDMQSIVNHDLQGEWNSKLVNHLKSDDFFGVETHPEASFTIKNASHHGDNNYKVRGDLTIKGITHPIEFTALIHDGMAKAKITVDRSKFDVRYGSGSFFGNLGDKTIYDNFELDVELKY